MPAASRLALLTCSWAVGVWAGIDADLLGRALQSKHDMELLNSQFAGVSGPANMFLNAVNQALHERGFNSIWPQLQEYVTVPQELADKLKPGAPKGGLRGALARRAKVLSFLESPEPLCLSVWDLEMRDTSSKAMYLDPSTSSFKKMLKRSRVLQNWIKMFPEDLTAIFWASRLAIRLGDFEAAHFSMIHVNEEMLSSSREICKLVPTALEPIRKGPPHGPGEVEDVEVISVVCQQEGRTFQVMANEMSDLVLLEARDNENAPASLPETTTESFRIRQQAYIDKDGLVPLQGPSTAFHHSAAITFSPESMVTLSGLRHHRDQANHLAEVAQASCAGAEASAADAASGQVLVTSLGKPMQHSGEDIDEAAQAAFDAAAFAASCQSVAQSLRDVAQRFEVAAARAVETNNLLEPEAVDTVLLPADAYREVVSFKERHFHSDPAGEALGADKPVLSAPAVAEKWQEIDHSYKLGDVLVIDDVFSEEVLTRLRLLNERSTIFHGWQGFGYLCSYWNNGFSAPLIGQVFAELQQALPSVLCDHRLINAWAYKYDDIPGDTSSHPSNGTGMHTDGAAVNINCWPVPGSSLSDPQYGGIKVWSKKAVTDDGSNYNKPGKTTINIADDGTFVAQFVNDPEFEAKILEVQKEEPVVVPYKQNRCVIFDSSLWHATNKVRTKPGFRNRRINLTFLAGVTGDTCEAAADRKRRGRLASAAIAKQKGDAKSEL